MSSGEDPISPASWRIARRLQGTLDVEKAIEHRHQEGAELGRLWAAQRATLEELHSIVSFLRDECRRLATGTRQLDLRVRPIYRVARFGSQ